MRDTGNVLRKPGCAIQGANAASPNRAFKIRAHADILSITLTGGSLPLVLSSALARELCWSQFYPDGESGKSVFRSLETNHCGMPGLRRIIPLQLAIRFRRGQAATTALVVTPDFYYVGEHTPKARHL